MCLDYIQQRHKFPSHISVEAGQKMERNEEPRKGTAKLRQMPTWSQKRDVAFLPCEGPSFVLLPVLSGLKPLLLISFCCLTSIISRTFTLVVVTAILLTTSLWGYSFLDFAVVYLSCSLCFLVRSLAFSTCVTVGLWFLSKVCVCH